MIELTTGIAFLLSSMYGAGNIPSDSLNVQPLKDSNEGSTAPITSEINRADLEKYLKENFSDTPILVEIARCESQMTHYRENGNVLRGKVDRADVGVMQINERYHLETSKKLGFDIHTVEGNVAYAKYLYEKFGSKPWNASAPCWGNKVVAMK